MRALVTGASGHLGAFVVRRLLQSGAQVEVLVRPSSDLWRLRDPLLGDVSEEVGVSRVEFSDSSALRETLDKARPEAVFHLAWGGITAGERDGIGQMRNVTQTLLLLEAAQNCGCGCFVGVGSQAEYGNGGAEGVSWNRLIEEGRMDDFSAYGLAKLCCGLLVQKFCEASEMRGAWLRLLATYGPQDDPRHLLPFVVEQLLRGEKPALTGGEQRWDYLFVEDAASAIVATATTPSAHGVFDLGSGRAPQIRELVECARDIIDPELPLGLGELPYRAGQLMFLQADLTRLQKQIDWAPDTDLQNGLRQTIDWQRATMAR